MPRAILRLRAAFTRWRGTILNAVVIAPFALLLTNCQGFPANSATHMHSSSDLAPTPASTPTPIHGPRIALECSEIDMGPISDEKPVPCTIRFWNVGDQPLEVRGVYGSTNGTRPSGPPQISPLPPSALPLVGEGNTEPPKRAKSPRINA